MPTIIQTVTEPYALRVESFLTQESIANPNMFSGGEITDDSV